MKFYSFIIVFSVYFSMLKSGLGQNVDTEKNDFDVLTIRKNVEEIIKSVNGYSRAQPRKRETPNLYTAFSNQYILLDGYRSLLETLVPSVAAAKYNVSEPCLDHFKLMLTALLNGEIWAVKMIDSNGKPSSGILEGKAKWVGSYQECVRTKAEVSTDNKTEITHQFSGKYCTAVVPTKLGQILGTAKVNFEMGMCFPDSCSTMDASVLINLLFSVIPLELIPPGSYAYARCKEEYPDKLSAKAVAIVHIAATGATNIGFLVYLAQIQPLHHFLAYSSGVVCSIFAAVMVLATLYDVLIVHRHLSKMFGYSNEVQPDVVEATDANEKTPLIPDVTMSSSYTQNGAVSHYKKDCEKVQLDLGKQPTPIPKPKPPPAYKPGTLERLLLSFSMYTNAVKIFNTSQPPGALTAVNGMRFLSMSWVILGHTYAFGYFLIENVEYIGQVYSRFTFQAVSNATVSVDSFFVLSGLLVAYLSLKEMEKRGGALKFKWGLYYFHRFWRLTPPYMLVLMVYTPLFKYLYTGPFWRDISKDECEDSWWKNLLYVNNIVDPKNQCMGWSWYLANDMQFYVLSPLLIVPLYYSGILGTIVCLAFLLTTFLCTALISKDKRLEAGNQPFNDVYVKPWIRIGPYVVGIFTGYILYKTKCKIRMHKLLNLLGWCLATALALAVLYGLYREEGQSKPNLEVSTLYNATFRTAWGVSVAWVVFACATGYGGPVNWILSWPALIPLSRLSYCAYLVHPIVMYMYYYSQQTYMVWSDLQVIYIFIGHMFLSYATAFIASLAFEAPMMGLEKVILGREKNS